MQNILFIGLGRMGAPMAGHLSKVANVFVANRSPAKVEKWLAQYNGQAHKADTVYDAIILCVGNDDDVRANLAPNGAYLPCLKAGGIVVDHTTTSATLAREQAQVLGDLGFVYLDAPVSGGEAGAVNGVLSAMVGGNENALPLIRPALESYCKNIVHIGESGAGQVCKMANQLCIAGTLAGLSEAIMLAKRSGINPENVYHAIKAGAAQSWQLDNRFPTMVADEFDFGFAIEHMIKDLGYALAQAEAENVQAVVAQKVLTDYQALLNAGYDGKDTSVLIKAYEK